MRRRWARKRIKYSRAYMKNMMATITPARVRLGKDQVEAAYISRELTFGNKIDQKPNPVRGEPIPRANVTIPSDSKPEQCL